LSNNTKYTPKARPLSYDPDFWANVRKNGLGDWLELDLYEHTRTLVEKLVGERPGTVLRALRNTVMSGTSDQFFEFFHGSHKPIISGWIASGV